MPGPPSGAWENYRAGAANVQSAQADARVNRAYQGNSRGYGGHGGYNNRNFGQLEMIQWQNIKLVPVQKDFAGQVHPITERRSREDVEKLRMKHSIHILEEGDSEGAPKPIGDGDFTEVSFPDYMINILKDKGFHAPTAIQLQSWPTALLGRDIVGIAETGSGKTMAYVPPMLVHVMNQYELKPGEGPVGIIILPNRELCEQVKAEVELFTKSAPELADIRVEAICGGSSVAEQGKSFLERVDIIVCTPGRLLDLLEKKRTNLRRATFVVLDEADDLLEGSFEPQIRQLLSQVRPDRQILLFSATWSNDMQALAKEICTFRPVYISVGSTKLAACKSIEQTFQEVKVGMHKIEMLDEALRKIGQFLNKGQRALVFCNRAESVAPTVQELQARGFLCAGVSSFCSQEERIDIVRRFSEGCEKLQFLVTTSLLGRGHDFQKLGFVINMDMPNRMTEYVHRIGRTGRAGEKGMALTFLELKDLLKASEIISCLKETQQILPTFLENATGRTARNKIWELMRRPASATPALHNGPAATPVLQNGTCGAATSEWQDREWQGRGQGRRHIFLAECRAAGIPIAT